MNLSENLRKSVEAYPDQRAYVYLGEQKTYREFNDEVNRLANSLQALGITQGSKVALILPNSAEFLIAYYALIRTGAVVIPINPMYKPDEAAYILQDGEVEALISIPQLLPVLDAVKPRVPTLKNLILTGSESIPGYLSFNQLLQQGSPEFSGPALGEDDVAVILYTSGTTGKPKGAMLTQKNLTSNVESTIEFTQITSADRIICVLPMFHVFCMTVCMNLSVAIGGLLVILPRFTPQDVVTAIKENQATMFAGVPTMYTFLLNFPGAAKEDLASLRLSVSGGAPLPLEVLGSFEAKFGKAISEGYGLSESSPVCTFNPIGKGKPGSIGINFPGVINKVVDENDNELPVGQVGELIVKGPNVMKGYFKLPEATAEAMRGGWLHTGDMAKMDEDGYFYIVDRKKDLILVGGYNVYPREVEEVVYQIPQVLEAAVVGLPDPQFGEAVKAVISLKSGQQLTAEEVINFCSGRLAKYKVPKVVEIWPELPKNSTGKILRRELRNLNLDKGQ